MGEIKSAWEIAREKAEKLGKLSAEEIRKGKEEKANSIGKAIAEKYLLTPDLNRLREVLGSYEGEEGMMIRQVVVSRLVETLELRGGKLKEVNQGILVILHNDKTLALLNEIEKLFEEYRQAEQTVKQKIDRAGREILHRLRISGTAIGDINPESREEWQRTLVQFTQPFEERLHNLKHELSGQLKFITG